MQICTKFRKKTLFNIIYFLTLAIPLLIFFRDFFYLKFDLLDLSIIAPIKASLIQGVLTVFFSFCISVIPAYYVAYNKNKLSSLIENLIFIPFIFPAISAVISFSIIYNLKFLSFFNLNYNLKSIIIANCFYNSPILVKYIAQGLQCISNDYEEEISMLPISEFKSFFLLKLPLMSSHVLKGIFLVFLYSFTSFILVIALGGIKYSTIEAEIASTLVGSSDFSKVIMLGGIQGFIMILINWFLNFSNNYEISYNDNSKKTKKNNKFLVFFSIIYLVFEILVVAISIIFSFVNIYTFKFSTAHYFTIFSKSFNDIYPVKEAFANSLTLSFWGAIIITLLAYLTVKCYTKFTKIIIWSSFGISSAFLAIILIYLNILYDINLKFLLIMGYIILFLPLAYSFMQNSIKNFPKDILEAALLETNSKYKIFFYIEFPILKNVALGVFLQIFAVLFGEITLAYTMQLGNIIPTIPLINYSMISNKKILESSALNTLILIFIFIFFYLSDKILKNKN